MQSHVDACALISDFSSSNILFIKTDAWVDSAWDKPVALVAKTATSVEKRGRGGDYGLLSVPFLLCLGDYQATKPFFGYFQFQFPGFISRLSMGPFKILQSGSKQH